MIDFLHQKCAELGTSIVPANPCVPEPGAAFNVFQHQIPGPQVRRVVTGIKQLLHTQGRCPLVAQGGPEISAVEANVRQMDNFMDQLNDSMHEELVQLVLDIMGHLGIAQ